MNVNKFIISKKISSRYLVHKILNGVFIDKKTKNQTLEYLTRKKILFEGAQGILLDVDHGTYPFVMHHLYFHFIKKWTK